MKRVVDYKFSSDYQWVTRIYDDGSTETTLEPRPIMGNDTWNSDSEPEPARYNFRTQKMDYGVELNDDIAFDYMPQNESLFGIYRCHRGLGLDITEAMLETLTKWIQVTTQTKNSPR